MLVPVRCAICGDQREIEALALLADPRCLRSTIIEPNAKNSLHMSVCHGLFVFDEDRFPTATITLTSSTRDAAIRMERLLREFESLARANDCSITVSTEIRRTQSRTSYVRT